MSQKIVNEFLKLVEIDNESLKERQMADYIKTRLKSMGYLPYEDDAGEKVGGNAGNVICKIPGSPELASVMFMAHMDSVYPCVGKKAIIEDGIIRSAGDTVLGSDDLSGVVAMLNLAENLIDYNKKRGDVLLVFTIGEEIGLLGARHLDIEKIKTDFAYVLDSGGDIGRATVSSPSHNTFKATISGKAAHAGMEPEKGINAIVVAANIISDLPLGRIDEETTANIGIIEGGKANNIVCDKVTINGEIRSRNLEKLEKLTKEIIGIFEKHSEKAGAKVQVDMVREYNSFKVDKNEPVLARFKKALSTLNIEYIEEHSGGGSDTNIIFNKGIKALTVSSGMENVHMLNEYIKIENLEKLEKLVLALVEG